MNEILKKKLLSGVISKNHSIPSDYYYSEGHTLYIAIKETMFKRSTNTYFKTQRKNFPNTAQYLAVL